MDCYLMHRIGQEDVERASFALRLLLASFEQVAEFGRLGFEFGEDLQAVVMIANIFLVDDEHRKQKVEQVPDEHRRPVLELPSQAFVKDLMQKQQYLTFLFTKVKKY